MKITKDQEIQNFGTYIILPILTKGVDLNTPNIEAYDTLSEFYEDIHPDREADFGFYRSLVRHRGDRVLDIACGTGEIARRMDDEGAQVVGLEASEGMIELARKTSASVTWVKGDMRSFDLDESFDVIVCGLNSLQHLETKTEITETLICIKKHLAPHGLLAFDIITPAIGQILLPKKTLKTFYSRTRNCELSLFEDFRYDPLTLLLHLTWRIVDPVTDTIIARKSFTMRWIDHNEVDELLASAGFSSIDKFGDFHGRRFTPSKTKQVVIAKVACDAENSGSP